MGMFTNMCEAARIVFLCRVSKIVHGNRDKTWYNIQYLRKKHGFEHPKWGSTHYETGNVFVPKRGLVRQFPSGWCQLLQQWRQEQHRSPWGDPGLKCSGLSCGPQPTSHGLAGPTPLDAWITIQTQGSAEPEFWDHGMVSKGDVADERSWCQDRWTKRRLKFASDMLAASEWTLLVIGRLIRGTKQRHTKGFEGWRVIRIRVVLRALYSKKWGLGSKHGNKNGCSIWLKQTKALISQQNGKVKSRSINGKCWLGLLRQNRWGGGPSTQHRPVRYANLKHYGGSNHLVVSTGLLQELRQWRFPSSWGWCVATGQSHSLILDSG